MQSISPYCYHTGKDGSNGTKTICVIGTVLYGAAIGAFAGAAMSVSGNPMFCFVAGTTVLTTLGKKAIENIQVGDTVPCIDHITGDIAEKKV